MSRFKWSYIQGWAHTSIYSGGRYLEHSAVLTIKNELYNKHYNISLAAVVNSESLLKNNKDVPTHLSKH